MCGLVGDVDYEALATNWLSSSAQMSLGVRKISFAHAVAEMSRLACDVSRLAMYMLSPQQLWLSSVVNFRHVPHEYKSVTSLYTSSNPGDNEPGCNKS